MKPPTILAVVAAAITLTSTALGDKYADLVAQGYRWATADGLYACVSKDDVRRMAGNPGDETLLKMIEQVKAYFLTPGTLVLVTEEDTHAGLSKIRMAGITVDLWTLSKFLSKHPMRDTYGVIETPETSGLIPTAAGAIEAGPSPTANFTPVPGTSPIPEASPLPGMSPIPEASPLPGMSPIPEASPAPGTSPEPGASPAPDASPTLTPNTNQ
jgi:hypothetical protein